MGSIQTIDYDGPITEQTEAYTVRDGGEVVLAGRVFTVTIHHTHGYPANIFLTGKRGGIYMLRPFLGPDSGQRQIVSMVGGQPLRVKGNEVRALLLGDIIETEYLR